METEAAESQLSNEERAMWEAMKADYLKASKLGSRTTRK